MVKYIIFACSSVYNQVLMSHTNRFLAEDPPRTRQKDIPTNDTCSTEPRRQHKLTHNRILVAKTWPWEKTNDHRDKWNIPFILQSQANLQLFLWLCLFFCKLPRWLYNKAFGERVYFSLLYHTTYETGITVVPSFQLWQ